MLTAVPKNQPSPEQPANTVTMPVRLAAAVAGAATTAIAASSSASTSSRGAATADVSPDRRRRRRRQIRGATTIDDAGVEEQNSCSDDAAADGDKVPKKDTTIGDRAASPLTTKEDATTNNVGDNGDDEPEDVFRDSCSDHIAMEQPSHEREQERAHTDEHDGAPNTTTDDCPGIFEDQAKDVDVAASSTKIPPDFSLEQVDGSSDDREGCISDDGETDDAHVQDEDECAAYDSSFDGGNDDDNNGDDEIGRASCRERVCASV